MQTIPIPNPPKSWSELTWTQLCLCWNSKMRYGGNADVARVSALLTLLDLKVEKGEPTILANAGETAYRLRDKDGRQWTVTAREASHLARQAMPWFDYPYGDPGEKEQSDEKGKVIKERREPVAGYVSSMHDALMLPVETLEVKSKKLKFVVRHFALPQVACNNLTWQQYRSLQAIAPQFFQEGVAEERVLLLQAQFLAHCLTPRSLALLDAAGGSIRLRPHSEYRYSADQADGLTKYWLKRLKRENERMKADSIGSPSSLQSSILFHVCFQCYQTALTYYSSVYPLLFGDSDRKETMRDALQGEVGTINTVMKYAGYAEQQQVYDSNLPFVLDILNTMAKEAKEIEKMNAKMKKK